jgi:hypothetical protein
VMYASSPANAIKKQPLIPRSVPIGSPASKPLYRFADAISGSAMCLYLVMFLHEEFLLPTVLQSRLGW